MDTQNVKEVLPMSFSLEYVARFLEDKIDPRTQDFFLMGNYHHLSLILSGYVIFCLDLGPWLMRDRKPFKLKKILIIYNTLNVIASLYVVLEGFQSGWGGEYSFACQPVDYSNNPSALRMANLVWFYYMLKLFELIDTVLFVLRKKTSQISFLHMIHHTMMPLVGFCATRFLPGGHGTLLGLINSMVHVVMYCYYLLAALGPAYKKYLWWKKYLTIMQIIQFIVVLLHLGQVLFRDCNFPKSIAFLMCINYFLFAKMFISFYINTYIRKPKKNKT